MPVLNAANLKALNEMQMKTMPKEQRRDAMMKLAQMKIAAQEDASHLLSQLATDLDGSSSVGRPGTGQEHRKPPSTAGSVRSETLSIAGSLRTRITDSLLAAEMRSRISKSKPAHNLGRVPETSSNFVDLSDSGRPGTGFSQKSIDKFFEQHQLQARPGTAASQRSEISVSQRSVRSGAGAPPSTAGSRPATATRAEAARKAALARGPELLPPVRVPPRPNTPCELSA